MTNIKIAITGGGTGGHLSIAKAAKEGFSALGIKPIYVGSTSGQDKKWFEADEDFEKKYFLASTGVVNKHGIAKIITLLTLLSNIAKSIKIIKQNNIDAVFSVGGYSAAPLVLASILTGKKLYIHEQNAVRGALNKLTAPFATTIFGSFEPSSPLKDYPVREAYFGKARIRKEVKTVIFLGGSQGAKKINELALAMAPVLNTYSIKIIHQAGERHFEAVSNEYKKLGIEADVFGFCDTLDDKIASSDFAVARSGAGTLFELAANNLPAFFIPYPHAAGNHQEFNAAFLSEKNCGFYKKESDVTEDDILRIIFDTEKINIASKNLAHIICPGGAAKIVEYIISRQG